jgi:hypothetical protein
MVLLDERTALLRTSRRDVYKPRLLLGGRPLELRVGIEIMQRDFDATATNHSNMGVVSKRCVAPYRSGDCRDWRKVKTAAWREANKERWRLFEQG